MKISITLPIRTISEANRSRKEHWGTTTKRKNHQRGAAKLAVYNHGGKLRDCRAILVTLTRIAPRKLDGDNLQRSFKAIRDGIADAIKIDDGADRYGWHYQQERGKPKEYAVRIDIEGVPHA